MLTRSRIAALVASYALAASPVFAQTSSVAPAVDRVFRISGAVAAPAGNAIGTVEVVEFAIYDSPTGGTPLWQELQTVTLDGLGQYTAFVGSTSADGLPVDLFATGEPRWLGTRVKRDGQAEQPRSLLTSVPYAVRSATAADAQTLGGRPASDFLLTPSARAGKSSADAVAGTEGAALDRPQVNNGSANFIGKFFNNVDLINSTLYDAGGLVGLNTTSPLDVFHTRFTNPGGSQTGIAVQNLSGSATAYSGMLFYDHTNTLRQFQGYNNGTGEYRINNISPTGSINFMIGGSSKFLVDTSGNIGMSQPTPGYKLDILHGGSTGIRVKSSGSFSTIDIDGASGDSALRFAANGVNQWNIRNRPADNYLEIFELGGGGSRVVVQDGTGYVGIGGTPTVPLEVFPTQGGIATTGAFSFFVPSSTVLGTGTNNTFSSVSIRASGQILANIFAAVSDERIKNVRGRSNGAADLDTLRGIEISDYFYKDTITKGDRPQKKVIAQQVEKIYPQAVSQTTDVVPDIFKKATVKDGWILLATDLKVGDRVRLITEGGYRAVNEVLEVESGRFRTNFTEDAEQVFVYGREVKDFRVVDYEAIAMLNVSATQELSRRVEQQTTDMAARAAEVAALKQELAEMRTALTAALEAVAAAAKAQQR